MRFAVALGGPLLIVLRMVGMQRLACAAVVCSVSGGLWAQEKEIHYSTDLVDYTMRFDEKRVSGLDMNAIALLSPFNFEDYKSPYMIGSSQVGDVFDKVFMVPSLEMDASTLPKIGREPVAPPQTSPFLRNAVRVLAYGRNEIQRLQGEKLPAVLDPVRDYLLKYLEFNLQMEQMRFSYIKDGDPKPPIRMLCKCRSCEYGAYKELVTRIEAASDEAARKEVTFASWYNAVLSCYTAHSGTYPVAVWKEFLKEFDVHESFIQKGVN